MVRNDGLIGMIEPVNAMIVELSPTDRLSIIDSDSSHYWIRILI